MVDHEKWDLRFLSLAKHISSWSKDPSTKVGAVIADEKHRVISLGYNGFPRGVPDNPDDYLNRDEKLKRVLHAEQNALAFSHKGDLEGCTIYTYPLFPCHRCALEVIQRGITRVVSVEYCPHDTRWGESCDLSKKLFKEASIEVVLYELPEGAP